MERQGAKVFPIANTDDKRQLTALLAANAGGDYLPPRIKEKQQSVIYK